MAVMARATTLKGSVSVRASGLDKRAVSGNVQMIAVVMASAQRMGPAYAYRNGTLRIAPSTSATSSVSTVYVIQTQVIAIVNQDSSQKIAQKRHAEVPMSSAQTLSANVD